MKNPLAGIIRMFQPKYSVIVNMYHVIPGTPVKKFEHRHDFGKDSERVFCQSDTCGIWWDGNEN